MTTQTFQINGMTCGHCEMAVRREIAKIDSVQDVHVSLAGGQVTVISTRPIDRAQAAAAVDEAGYELAS